MTIDPNKLINITHLNADELEHLLSDPFPNNREEAEQKMSDYRAEQIALNYEGPEPF
tara:strand:- start:889 stop:1059 length:171 start_codon:yes stop_codon:yes gene_type:complete